MPFIALCQISTPQWVNGIGGAGSNSVPSGVISDNQNNIYITGTFQGTVDFDVSAATKNLTSNGNFDVYVAKYTTMGQLIWAVSMGGSGLDQESSNMAIDASGNITIGGLWDSSSMDVDPGPGVFNLQNSGGLDGFIVHLDGDGKFLWGKSIGSSGRDIIHKIATDKAGNVIAIGQFESTITIGNISLTSPGGGTNGLTAKFDPAGNLLWAVNIGQSGYNETRGIALDASDNVIISGAFNGNTNFNPLGTTQNANAGSSSTFVAKYTPLGMLIWVKSVAGPIVNNNTFLCVDSNNSVYLSAPFSSPLTFNGSTVLNRTGSQDFFLAKFDSDGSFKWTKGIGGTSATTYNYGIIVSKDNYLYCSGYFTGSVDFNPSTGSNTLTSSRQDFFLAKYDTDGNYKYAFNAGNSGCDQTGGRNLTIDSNNDLLLVGSYCANVNFSATACAPYPLVAKSPRESFLAKYVQNVSASEITDFSIPQMKSFVLDKVNLKITVTMPANTDVRALVPSIATTGGTLNPLSGTSRNFTEPVIYTLTNGCTSLNYLVTVTTSTSTSVAICSGSSTTLKGDLQNPVSETYSWEILRGNSWVIAPGISNQSDYLTTNLINTTNSRVVISLRRKITTQNVSSYDSMYDLTIESGSISQLVQPVSTVVETTSSTITFNWTDVVGAASYEVSVDGGETFGDPASIGGITSTFDESNRELTFQTLDAGDQITLVVRALGNTKCASSEKSIPVTGMAISTVFAVSIPNTFTPNGDGNNDVLLINSSGLKTMRWSIYNRWGNKIFETLDVNLGWDGTFNGSVLPVGVYYYYFNAIMFDDSRVEKKGALMLIK